MPAQSKNKNKRSPAHRRNSTKRIKPEGSVSERRLPGGTGGASAIAAPARTAFSNLLNPETKLLSAFHVSDPMVFVDEDYDPEGSKMGDMKEWLSTLYACLKQHPKFKDGKEWKQLPTVNQLAEYLFGEVDRLAESGWRFAKNTNCQFQITFFHYLSKYEGACTMPLEWLELLEEENAELAELCLCMICKISDSWYLDFIYTQWTEMVVGDDLDYFLDRERIGEDEYDIPLVECYKSYQKGGKVESFALDCRRMARRFSNEKLIDYIKRFKYTSKLELSIYDWLDAGIVALKNPSPIGKYINPSDREYEDGAPLNAGDIYAFHWSFIDPVYRKSEEWMNDQCNHFGLEAPIVAKICTEKSYTSDGTAEHVEILDTFMDKGRKMYFDFYHRKLERLHEERSKQILIEVEV